MDGKREHVTWFPTWVWNKFKLSVHWEDLYECYVPTKLMNELIIYIFDDQGINWFVKWGG